MFKGLELAAKNLKDLGFLRWTVTADRGSKDITLELHGDQTRKLNSNEEERLGMSLGEKKRGELRLTGTEF